VVIFVGSMLSYVCIECGSRAESLYRRYDGSVIKVSQCSACDSTVDKYIESESVLILLDAILHKLPAYRHILHNIDLTWFKKLLVILLLCDAYHVWLSHRITTELHFYRLLGSAMLEWTVVVGMVWLLLNIYTNTNYFITKPGCDKKHMDFSLKSVLCCMTVSSFGKLLVVPASIWLEEQTGATGEQPSMPWEQTGVCWTLIQAFILTSNIAALKARFSLSFAVCLCLLMTSHVIQWLLFTHVNVTQSINTYFTYASDA